MATSRELPDQPLSVDEFLRCILRSNLLDRTELQAALKGVPRQRRDDVSALAEHLVRSGKLTRFQASKLQRGICKGLIIGPFRVLAPLGKGAMGTVFLVRDTRSSQVVALKILPPKLAREEERMLARFRREMELNQKVAHPHLAWTYDVGEYRGVHYIAMEYIPGKTLSRLVADERRLSVTRAARLMAEVCSALDHAHNAGLIHRDLKPSNILITPRDHAKVLDLGLALIHGETVDDARVVGGQGYIVGTMDYIAPEQTIDAAAVDRRSDIYSVGCTLYYALSGQPPFPGGTSKEKIQRHRRDQPTPLAELVPDLPAGFVALVERLMAKNPADRPATAQEVEQELRMWATGEAEQLFAELEELPTDETAILGQAPASSEFSRVELPEVEVLESEEEELPIPPVEHPATEPTVRILVFAGLGLGILALILLLVGLIVALARS